MYSFGHPIFAPLPMGVTVPWQYPVMFVIVSVVCGFCFCLGIHSLYIVYTYKVFGGKTLKNVNELNTYHTNKDYNKQKGYDDNEYHI